MKKDYTDMTVLLDRSGSMQVIRNDMEGGFNSFRDEQKKLPGILKISLYQFDDTFEEVYIGKDSHDVPDLELLPRGSTALIDSAYKAIIKTGERINAMKDNDKPEKVIFIIITDGMENASHEMNRTQLKKLIETQTKKWSWEFVYIGANQDSFAEATSYGINTVNTMHYSADTKSVNVAFVNLSCATTRSRSAKVGDTGGYFDAGETNVDTESVDDNGN